MTNKLNDFEGYKGKYGKKIAGAYKITHKATGKFYIGSSGDYYNRTAKNMQRLRCNFHHNKELQKLYNESPYFRLDFYLTGIDGIDKNLREEAYDFEQNLLNIHKNSPLLLNVSIDARKLSSNVHLGRIQSQETKDKIAQSNKKYWENNEYHAINSAKIKETRNRPELKEKQSVIALNQWQDSEFVAKMIASRNTQEAREANSKRNKEMWSNPDYRSKMISDRNTPEYLEIARLRKKDKMKSLSIDGVIYDSIADATRILKMRRETIRARCSNSKFQNYYYI